MTGQLCPECGAPRTAQGEPGRDDSGGRDDRGDRGGCDCAARAAGAVQAGRSEEIAAEVAATEDFHTLRMRPYVTLDAQDDTRATFRTAGPLPPLAAPKAAAGPSAVTDVTPEPPPARRKPLRAVAIGAVVVAVIGTAAFVGGLFEGDDGAARALPKETHTGAPAPDAATRDASATPTPSKKPSSSPTPSATKSASPSPSPSTSSPATPQAPPPARTTPTTAPKPTTQAPERPDQPPAGASLRLGDSGPEVFALQQRLAEVRLFRGQPDGKYDQRVEGGVRIYQAYRQIGGDPAGVYGPNTRKALEAETQGRGGRH
ncbi:peptidoglycan-binding protein [Streptomyces sp. NPDC088400]|uniref:peptidoglycan-binding domain-containing protein n=1 Tax=Streptomyces sp. NPDC088400 TaxID=3365861 RepID=UPI00382212AB